jgi:hypothetical protein
LPSQEKSSERLTQLWVQKIGMAAGLVFTQGRLVSHLPPGASLNWKLQPVVLGWGCSRERRLCVWFKVRSLREEEEVK